MTEERRNTAIGWGMVLIILIAATMIIVQFDWNSMISQNIAWINLLKESFPNERTDIYRDTSLSESRNSQEMDTAPSSNSYPHQISILLGQADYSQLEWSDTPNNARGLVHLWSAFQFCNQSLEYGPGTEENCESNILSIGNVLLNHKLLPDIHQWDCRQVMNWLVLSEEIPNSQEKTYWQKRLSEQCPDHYAAYLMQNTNGQVKVAEAYGRLGLYDRAIAVGESFLEGSNWSWGHFVVSEFYLATGDLASSEEYLHEAIDKSKGEEHISHYHYSLAELLRTQGRDQAATEQYCVVLNDTLDNRHTRKWKPLASSALQDMNNGVSINPAIVCPG